jgi:hypothetical protein
VQFELLERCFGPTIAQVTGALLITG